MTSGSASRPVLVLAYFFPPLGGAGVQRVVKFLRYLPEFGFGPSVVTGPDFREAAWPPRDESLGHEVGPQVPVYRASLPEGAASSPKQRGVRRAVSRLLDLPSPFARAWVRGCEDAALRAARETSPRLVFATMSPFETAAPAARVAARLQIPWVADLRDPWALDEMMVYATALHRVLDLRRMRRALESASAIIMNTPEAAEALRVLMPGYPASRVFSIPNGYDAADFEAPLQLASEKRFTIVHTGHLHAELGLRHRRRRRMRSWLGGERVPVDILPRSHAFLLQALRRWRDAEPAMADDVRVVLAGPVGTVDRELVAGSGVGDLVELRGYVEHTESVRLIREAQVLFLPMHALPAGERARIVPGKTYEYLAAGRPILAAVPEGDARDLLAASGIADCCTPDDVGGMLVSLRRRYADWRAGSPPPAPNQALLARYERRELTHSLSEVFDEVIGRASGR